MGRRKIFVKTFPTQAPECLGTKEKAQSCCKGSPWTLPGSFCGTWTAGETGAAGRYTRVGEGAGELRRGGGRTGRWEGPRKDSGGAMRDRVRNHMHMLLWKITLLYTLSPWAWIWGGKNQPVTEQQGEWHTLSAKKEKRKTPSPRWPWLWSGERTKH